MIILGNVRSEVLDSHATNVRYKNRWNDRATSAVTSGMRHVHVKDLLAADEPPGRPTIFASQMATSPSTAFVPLDCTLEPWLIPVLVLGRRPETYLTVVW